MRCKVMRERESARERNREKEKEGGRFKLERGDKRLEKIDLQNISLISILSKHALQNSFDKFGM